MRHDFFHYILDGLWFVWQEEVEMLEEDGEVGLGLADDAQTEVGAGGGGQDNVEGTNFGHFFEEFAGGLAEAGGGHPVLKGTPQNKGEEAHEDVGLGPVLFLMKDGAQAQIVFADAETVFDLGQADVGAPEFVGGVALQVGA